MPREFRGLERAKVFADGKIGLDPQYMSGWVPVPPPTEKLLLVSGFVYSQLFMGAVSRTAYKRIKRTNKWYSFSFTRAA